MTTPNVVEIKDYSATEQPILADYVTDALYGQSGYTQVVKIFDATEGSTNKLVINTAGQALVNTAQSITGNAPTAVSVGVTSTSVLASNTSRKGLVVVNTSANIISLGLDGAAAVLNSGITLVPYGVWVMDDMTYSQGAIHAIASGASSNLSVQEMQ